MKLKEYKKTSKINEGILSKIKDKFSKNYDDSVYKIDKHSQEDVKEYIDNLDPVHDIKFISSELRMSPTTFIKKNMDDIIKYIKSNAGSSIKKFGTKNKSNFEKSDIDKNTKDYNDDLNIFIDEKSSEFGCMFEGESGKKIIDICEKLKNGMENTDKLSSDVAENVEEEVTDRGASIPQLTYRPTLKNVLNIPMDMGNIQNINNDTEKPEVNKEEINLPIKSEKISVIDSTAFVLVDNPKIKGNELEKRIENDVRLKTIEQVENDKTNVLSNRKIKLTIDSIKRKISENISDKNNFSITIFNKHDFEYYISNIKKYTKINFVATDNIKKTYKNVLAISYVIDTDKVKSFLKNSSKIKAKSPEEKIAKFTKNLMNENNNYGILKQVEVNKLGKNKNYPWLLFKSESDSERKTYIMILAGIDSNVKDDDIIDVDVNNEEPKTNKGNGKQTTKKTSGSKKRTQKKSKENPSTTKKQTDKKQVVTDEPKKQEQPKQVKPNTSDVKKTKPVTKSDNKTDINAKPVNVGKTSSVKPKKTDKKSSQSSQTAEQPDNREVNNNVFFKSKFFDDGAYFKSEKIKNNVLNNELKSIKNTIQSISKDKISVHNDFVKMFNNMDSTDEQESSAIRLIEKLEKFYNKKKNLSELREKIFDYDNILVFNFPINNKYIPNFIKNSGDTEYNSDDYPLYISDMSKILENVINTNNKKSIFSKKCLYKMYLNKIKDIDKTSEDNGVIFVMFYGVDTNKYENIKESLNESLLIESSIISKSIDTLFKFLTHPRESYRLFVNGSAGTYIQNIHNSLPTGGIMWLLPLVKLAQMGIKYKDDISKFVGSQVIKVNDAKGVIATMNFYLNGVKYSLRFSIEDFSWHCINLDDRHAKVDDDFVKKLLRTDLCNKFKTHCIETWNKIFKDEDTDNMSPFVIMMKGGKDIKINKKIFNTINKIGDNYSKIEEQFK